MLVQKSFDPNNYGSTKFWVHKILAPKKIWVQTFSNFVSKKICRSKKVWVKQNLVQKYFDQKKSRPPKIVSKKFCQNWVSSWNIHDMGKFCQDQCFLDKCDHDSWNRGSQELPLKFGQNWVSNSWDITYMDKCRQDKCCMGKMWLWQLASVKEGPSNLPLKFGQNLTTNTWDITSMDKCR